MARNDTKKVASTEYAVEVFREKEDGVSRKFVRQIDCFSDLEKAEAFIDAYDKTLLDPKEYLDVTFIECDENGDEIDYGPVV